MENDLLSKRMWDKIVVAAANPSQLQRIQIACDAIEARDCSGLSGVKTHADFLIEIGGEITLTSVDRYLKHRRRTEPGFEAP